MITWLRKLLFGAELHDVFWIHQWGDKALVVKASSAQEAWGIAREHGIEEGVLVPWETRGYWKVINHAAWGTRPA